MKNKRNKYWKKILNNEKYNEFFIDKDYLNIKKFHFRLKKIKEFIDKNRKKPNKNSENKYEKNLANYFSKN